MLDRARDAVLAFLRVPREIHPPAGDAARTQVFRAAPNFFRYQLALWTLKQLGALVGLLGGYALLQQLAQVIGRPWVTTAITVVEGLGVLAYLVNLPVSLAILRLDFEQRWYAVSDRALRIREGILHLREQTMTFANIQQVGIRQGPLQRLLGLADVHVSTAGGAGGSAEDSSKVGHGMHEGFFRGVANAAEIRDLIRERVRLHRDAGLGDPDDTDHMPGEPPALAAAREIRDEIRALGRTLGVAPAPPAGQS